MLHIFAILTLVFLCKDSEQILGTDDSCIFNEEELDLDQLLLVDEKDKLADYRKRDHAASSSSSSSSGRSSPETGLTSKESFLSWRKRSKIASKSREIHNSSCLENKSSGSSTVSNY